MALKYKFQFKGDTLADAQAKNRLLILNEPYIVVHPDGTWDLWKGNGVDRFNSLPASAKHASGVSSGEVTELVIPYVWDEGSGAYIEKEGGIKMFIGSADPGPSGTGQAGEGDLWEQETVINAPSNFTATVVNGNQINLAWQDNSDNEDRFEVEQAVYKDWTSDISDGDTVSEGERVLYSGTVYLVTTTHAVGTPKTFTAGNYTESDYAYTKLSPDSAANATSRQITGLAYNTRYRFRVSACKGTVKSVNNPTAVAKTGTAATSQSDLIAAFSNLYFFIKMYESGSPLLDSSGNGRSFTGQANTLYQQAAIENSDSPSYSIRSNNNETGWIYLGNAWGLNQNWEIGCLVKVPTGGFVGGKAFFGLYKNGTANSKIRVWTNSTDPTKIQISVIDDAGGWFSSAVSAATLLPDTTYMLSMRYDAATTTLSLYVNGVLDITFSRNLATGITVDRVSFGSDGANRATGFYQKGYATVGSYPSNEQRATAHAAGNYV